MSGLEEQRRKVERIIKEVSELEGVGRGEARKLIHKYVCEGKCGWYRTESMKAGFDRLSLSGKQEKIIEGTVKEVMKDLTMEEARFRIHEILCPGHPRPRPK